MSVMIRRADTTNFLQLSTIVTAGAATILIALQIAGVRISPVNGFAAYLLLTLLAACSFGYRTGIAVAAVSTVLLNFFFFEPLFGLTMSESQHIASLPVLFITAAIGGSLHQELSKGGRSAVTSTANVLELGDLRIDSANHLVFVDGQEVHLTPTEFRLLDFFAANVGKVLRPQAILENVWGHEYASDVRILRTYINQLRTKLNDTPACPRFIRTEAGFGYRFLEPADR
jgi:DNA-binding winged helix-turn-helix (wHTH) protein